MNQWQVATSAEAFAAGQFARCGWDVSVQYGANQPEYDLVAVKGDKALKVSVKGSQDGGWGLTQSFIKNADYHAAADEWLAKHGSKTLFCFVQFMDVGEEVLPRMYLATPRDVASHLKKVAKGRGSGILYEQHDWGPRAYAAGTTDAIPVKWKFTARRLEELAKMVEKGS